MYIIPTIPALQAFGSTLLATVCNNALLEVQDYLQAFSKTMADVGMPTPEASASIISRAEREELRTEEQRQALQQFLDLNLPSLNADQRAVYDRVTSAIQLPAVSSPVCDILSNRSNPIICPHIMKYLYQLLAANHIYLRLI